MKSKDFLRNMKQEVARLRRQWSGAFGTHNNSDVLAFFQALNDAEQAVDRLLKTVERLHTP